MAPLPLFTELGRGMGWSTDEVIAMLWIYFDESGEHGHDGKLRRLCLGCGIARFEAWEALSLEWKSALDHAGVPAFHMTDFEARRGPFDGWSEKKRRATLNALLDIANRHVSVFCGFIDNPRDLSSKRAFKDAYGANLIKAFKEIILKLDETEKEPITIVFARHKDINAAWIGRYFDFFSYWTGDRVRLGGFGDPETVCPLQVADIAAYEFSRAARETRPENERYPLTTLAKRASVFTLFYASQLGQDVSVWGRPFPANPLASSLQPKASARKRLRSRPRRSRGPSR